MFKSFKKNQITNYCVILHVEIDNWRFRRNINLRKPMPSSHPGPRCFNDYVYAFIDHKYPGSMREQPAII